MGYSQGIRVLLFLLNEVNKMCNSVDKNSVVFFTLRVTGNRHHVLADKNGKLRVKNG